MNKEQIEEIALDTAHQISSDCCLCGYAQVLEFTHALLAELAKEQKPVGYIASAYRGVIDGKSEGIPMGAQMSFINMGWRDQIQLYTIPLTQPDLVAEIEHLRMALADTEALEIGTAERCKRWRGSYKMQSQQLAAAQVDNEQLVAALRLYSDRSEWTKHTCASAWKLAFNQSSCDGDGYLIAEEAIAAHKARKEQL